MEKLELYSLNEVKDRHIGKVGTPARTKYEDYLQAFLVSEALNRHEKLKI